MKYYASPNFASKPLMLGRARSRAYQEWEEILSEADSVRINLTKPPRKESSKEWSMRPGAQSPDGYDIAFYMKEEQLQAVHKLITDSGKTHSYYGNYVTDYGSLASTR